MSFDQAINVGGVAVVTGAASGVGLAAAKRFAEAGLSVVIADTNESALHRAEDEVSKLLCPGKSALSVPTDVSSFESVWLLAEMAFATGPVSVLMNNAGIVRPTTSFSELLSWRELIDVNLMGVINGMHAFLPRMVELARPAVVINTGSKQGITTPPGNPAYNVSKAGVKVATEMLAHDLRRASVPISAHLFVPGFTYTGMMERFFPEQPPGAWTSEQAVEHMFGRVQAGDFYILCPDNEVDAESDRRRIEWAIGDIVHNRPALSRWHPDFEEAFAAHELRPSEPNRE